MEAVRARVLGAVLDEQSTARGENALCLLLHVLAEKTGPDVACYHDLRALAAELGESWR